MKRLVFVVLCFLSILSINAQNSEVEHGHMFVNKDDETNYEEHSKNNFIAYYEKELYVSSLFKLHKENDLTTFESIQIERKLYTDITQDYSFEYYMISPKAATQDEIEIYVKNIYELKMPKEQEEKMINSLHNPVNVYLEKSDVEDILFILSKCMDAGFWISIDKDQNKYKHMVHIKLRDTLKISISSEGYCIVFLIDNDRSNQFSFKTSDFINFLQTAIK